MTHSLTVLTSKPVVRSFCEGREGPPPSTLGRVDGFRRCRDRSPCPSGTRSLLIFILLGLLCTPVRPRSGRCRAMRPESQRAVTARDGGFLRFRPSLWKPSLGTLVSGPRARRSHGSWVGGRGGRGGGGPRRRQAVDGVDAGRGAWGSEWSRVRAWRWVGAGGPPRPTISGQSPARAGPGRGPAGRPGEASARPRRARPGVGGSVDPLCRGRATRESTAPTTTGAGPPTRPASRRPYLSGERLSETTSGSSLHTGAEPVPTSDPSVSREVAPCERQRLTSANPLQIPSRPKDANRHGPGWTSALRTPQDSRDSGRARGRPARRSRGRPARFEGRHGSTGRSDSLVPRSSFLRAHTPSKFTVLHVSRPVKGCSNVSPTLNTFNLNLNFDLQCSFFRPGDNI